MNELEVRNVPFMGTDLVAAQDESGQVWAGVRWICDGIGMSEGQMKRQIANIRADRVLSKSGSNLILNKTGNGTREVFCLKLDYVPLWLAKINITPLMEQENPELADRLEQFQLRAKDVLATAFLPAQTEPAPLTPAQLLAAQAQVLVDMEQRMNQMQGQTRALEAKVETAIRAFSRPDKDHWKEDMDKAVKEVCELYGSSIIKLKGQLYAELEQKANCNINSRLAALRRRSKKTGMRYSDTMALNKLDAIAADKKLRAIFEGIVRSWQATSIPVSGTLEVEGEARHEG